MKPPGKEIFLNTQNEKKIPYQNWFICLNILGETTIEIINIKHLLLSGVCKKDTKTPLKISTVFHHKSVNRPLNTNTLNPEYAAVRLKSVNWADLKQTKYRLKSFLKI